MYYFLDLWLYLGDHHLYLRDIVFALESRLYLDCHMYVVFQL